MVLQNNFLRLSYSVEDLKIMHLIIWIQILDVESLMDTTAGERKSRFVVMQMTWAQIPP